MSNSYEDWFSENKTEVVTQFAINTHRNTDEKSLHLLEEEFIDEIDSLGREMFREECLLAETQDTIINQINRGNF